MVPYTTRLALGVAALALVSGIRAEDDYASVYTGARGAVSPPRSLRTAEGLPPMVDLVGQVVQVDAALRQIMVRDRADQLHRFIVPPYATISDGANLHENRAALQACLHRQVRIRYVSAMPGPDRFRAIDIFPAG